MKKYLLGASAIALLAGTPALAYQPPAPSATEFSKYQGSQGGTVVLGQTAMLARYPNFYTKPEFTLNNAVLVPGTAGSTTYNAANSTSRQAQNLMMQEFYLYVQRQSLFAGAQHFASTHIATCIKGIVTGQRFAWKTNTPLYIPRYTCPDDAMSWERDGTGSIVSVRSNWNGDPTTNQLNNLWQYMLIIAPGGTTAPGKIVGNLNSTGSDGGNGLAYGRMYDASHVALQATGSGADGSGSASCTVSNGDTSSPSAGAVITVTTAGGIATGISSPSSGQYSRYGSNTGHYYLPPVLQRMQWTVANGWDGDSAHGNADFSHPKVFADELNYYYNATCNHGLTGVTVSMTFQPDYCVTGDTADADSTSCTTRTDGPKGQNAYFGIFPGGSANTGFIDQVYMVQSRQNYSATYGYTNAVLIAGFEVTVNYIQTQLAAIGTNVYGSDVVIRDMNSVTDGVPLKVRGGGGMHILHARFDTPSDLINADGHAAEFDHCSSCSLKTWDYIATGSDSTNVTGAQIRLGSDTSISNATSQNTNVYIGPGNISSDVTTSVHALTAIYCAFTNSSTIEAYVSNTGFANTARTQLFTTFATFGNNCETSNTIRGHINGIGATTSIFSGTIPALNFDVWDGTCHYGAGGRCEINAAGAPSNGTTGDNKAMISSSYNNITNGDGYRNTGAIDNPTWTKFTP